jgi:hypothetical protein
MVSNNCKRKPEMCIPKDKIVKHNNCGNKLYANFSFVKDKDFNSIYIEFINSDTQNLIINNLSALNFLTVEKKINSKFINYNYQFFVHADTILTGFDGITYGIGDSSVERILSSPSEYKNYQWYRHLDRFNNIKDSLKRYFKKYVDDKKSCVDYFIHSLNFLKKSEKIGKYRHINKEFEKGNVYRFYISYEMKVKKKYEHIYCSNFIDSLPPIKDFKVYRDKIISDTLYLICE